MYLWSRGGFVFLEKVGFWNANESPRDSVHRVTRTHFAQNVQRIKLQEAPTPSQTPGRWQAYMWSPYAFAFLEKVGFWRGPLAGRQLFKKNLKLTSLTKSGETLKDMLKII